VDSQVKHDSKNLEQQFIDDYNQSASSLLMRAGITGLVCYNLFIIFDYFSYPETVWTHAAIRLGFVTPTLMIILFALRQQRFKPYTRSLILLGALIFALPVVYFEWSNRPSMIGGSLWGVIFVAMFGLTTLRMLQREAVIYTAVLLASVSACLVIADAPPAAWFNRLFPLSVICFFGIFATYIMESGWRKIHTQKKIIERQERQAAGLLEVVFPAPVAQRLKSERSTIAEYAGSVSVLFADIEGFTAASQVLTPGQLVSDLDAIFSRIDALCIEHGCEKIKTVGDAYMAVCGLPLPAEDHAKKILGLALAMQRAASELTLGGKPIRFRIGVHSGPVVAGVIGKSRFSYDLWGDTVNTASRMESTAPVGGIQISDETAKAVDGAFIVEPRGEIQVKGKGLLHTWLVTGTKAVEQDQSQTSDRISA
jgi:adenylate cyclase